jgi:hypothetical protein
MDSKHSTTSTRIAIIENPTRMSTVLWLLLTGGVWTWALLTQPLSTLCLNILTVIVVSALLHR